MGTQDLFDAAIEQTIDDHPRDDVADALSYHHPQVVIDIEYNGGLEPHEEE